MNASLQQLIVRLCPTNAPLLLYAVVNFTTSQDYFVEVPVTLCDTASLVQYGIDLADLVNALTCYIAPIGLVTCLISLIVLFNRLCNEVTFVYHRAINIADLIYLLLLFVNGLRGFAPTAFEHSLALCQLTAIFGSRLDNAFPDFISLVVMWISIERTFCYFPALFARINRRRVAGLLIGVLAAVAAALNVPSALAFRCIRQQTPQQRYQIVQSSFGLSPGYGRYLDAVDSLYLVRAVLVCLGTSTTILVFYKISRKKRQIAVQLGEGSASTANLMAQSKLIRMLCLLQFSESLPLLVDCCATIAVQSVYLYFDFDTFLSLSFQESQSLIALFVYRIRLTSAKKIIQLSCHLARLLFYVLFVKRFRAAVQDLFQRFRRTFSRNSTTVFVLK